MKENTAHYRKQKEKKESKERKELFKSLRKKERQKTIYFCIFIIDEVEWPKTDKKKHKIFNLF